MKTSFRNKLDSENHNKVKKTNYHTTHKGMLFQESRPCGLEFIWREN